MEHTRTPVITMAADDSDWDDAAILLHDYFHWVEARTPIDVAAAQPLADVERTDPLGAYSGPGRGLLIARLGRLPVGIVGLRPRPDEGAAELVRFFVRPVARGTNVGRSLLASAITLAAELGYDRIVLETLPSHMAAAVHLYEAAGLAPMAPSRCRASP